MRKLVVKSSIAPKTIRGVARGDLSQDPLLLLIINLFHLTGRSDKIDSATHLYNPK